MSLSIQEFKARVVYWNKTNWPDDFHNSFYQYMAKKMAKNNSHADFNQEWWEWFLCRLHDWRANRPKSKKYLTDRMKERVSQIIDAWKEFIVPNIEKDIAQIEWMQISRFPDIVSEIKNVSSPVFTSKFCHFLAPHIFPVIDNTAMGKPFGSYQEYYEAGRKKWNSTSSSVQKDMEKSLTATIGGEIHVSYPMKCKIIEQYLTNHSSRPLTRQLNSNVML